MNPDGSGQTRLTDTDVNEDSPELSPGGRRIVFTAQVDGGADIFVMNADGTGRTRLTSLTAMRLGAVRPAWSPDGSRIAFQSYANPDVYVINRADEPDEPAGAGRIFLVVTGRAPHGVRERP